MATERPTPRAEAEIETRRAEAMRLRIRGKSYREIAAATGVSLGQAFADVKAVLDRTKAEADDDADQARALDLERIDRAIGIVEDILSAGDPIAEPGQDEDDLLQAVESERELKLKALDRLVKLQDQRAKLLGLYAPEKKEVTGADGAPIAIDARGALLERLASLAASAPAAGTTGGGDSKPE